MRSLLRNRPPLLALFAVVLFLVYAGHAQEAKRGAARVQAVGAISTTVSDMDRSVAFYSQVLTFAKTSDQELSAGDTTARVVQMKLGEESIELVQFQGAHGRMVPKDSRSNDRWFQHVAIIVSDMDRAYAVLKADHVESASVAPQRLPDWNRKAAGIRAFYFKDPDGHPLEILQFPAGKGGAKWHRKTDKLFLGIDHTAIVVADTNASLKFYRDLLGLRVAGESENYGIEQERLNNVPGAHLRITTLRADRGPGIELLEYLAPRTGRNLAFDPDSIDLVHRHTVIVATKNSFATAALATIPYPLAKEDAFLISDPDGHQLLVHRENHVSIGEVK